MKIWCRAGVDAAVVNEVVVDVAAIDVSAVDVATFVVAVVHLAAVVVAAVDDDSVDNMPPKKEDNFKENYGKKVQVKEVRDLHKFEEVPWTT